MPDLRTLFMDCFGLVDRLSHYNRTKTNPICPFCGADFNNNDNFQHDDDCLVIEAIRLFSHMKEYLTNNPATDEEEES